MTPLELERAHVRDDGVRQEGKPVASGEAEGVSEFWSPALYGGARAHPSATWLIDGTRVEVVR